MRTVLAWAFALLLLPGAAAASTLSLESASPVEVDAAFEVAMAASSLLLFEPQAAGVREIRAVTGVVTFWTWREVSAAAPASIVQARQQVEPARAESFTLSNATLRLVPDGGPFELVARLGDGAEAAVSGRLRGEGKPVRMGRAAEEPVGPPSPLRGAGDVSWRYAAGWSYAGNHLLGHETGLPAPEDAHARLEGPLRLKLSYGRVEFRDAEGREVRRDLGPLPAATPGPETWRRLVLDASAASARLPAPAYWGLSGPDARWVVEGEATWRNASGEVAAGGAPRRFEDATVRIEGRVMIAPEAPMVEAPLARAGYEGRGAFAARVDGIPVRAPAVASVAGPIVAGSFAALAALALLAWKGAGFLFTRLAPGDVLAHPRRRALYDAVAHRPGERLRDLQRRTGLAWGAFSFHLDVLIRSGHLRLRKEGAYTLVLLRAPGEVLPLIPHPSARAVYEQLPPDGTPVPFPELRARLGFSRQRVNHHLQALESRGLVEVRRRPDGARDVARRAASPSSAGPT